jgi:nucleoid-associated protein YgaU
LLVYVTFSKLLDSAMATTMLRNVIIVAIGRDLFAGSFVLQASCIRAVRQPVHGLRSPGDTAQGQAKATQGQAKATQGQAKAAQGQAIRDLFPFPARYETCDTSLTIWFHCLA